MTQQLLQTQIQKLREMLADTADIDANTKAQLQALDDHIRPLVDAPDNDDHDHASIAERLEASLAEFELDHPVLTAQITTVINTLSNMGI